MDGYSVWDEASRDYDSEARLTAQANLHVASNGVMQYLALAQSSDEFEGRLMLAASQIQDLADNAGLGLDEVTASLRNRWALLVESGNVTLLNDVWSEPSEKNPYTGPTGKNETDSAATQRGPADGRSLADQLNDAEFNRAQSSRRTAENEHPLGPNRKNRWGQWVDSKGNASAQDGVDRCECGSKSWKDDACNSCGTRWSPPASWNHSRLSSLRAVGNRYPTEDPRNLPKTYGDNGGNCAWCNGSEGPVTKSYLNESGREDDPVQYMVCDSCFHEFAPDDQISGKVPGAIDESLNEHKATGPGGNTRYCDNCEESTPHDQGTCKDCGERNPRLNEQNEYDWESKAREGSRKTAGDDGTCNCPCGCENPLEFGGQCGDCGEDDHQNNNNLSQYTSSRRTAVSAIDPEYAAKHLEVMPAERKGKFDSDGYPKRYTGDLDCPNCGSKEMEEGGDGEGRVDDRQCPDCGHQEFPVEGMRTKIPSTLDPKKISYRYSKVIGLKDDEGWENNDGSTQPAGDRAGHQVDALHDGEKVGHIKWLAEDSEVDGGPGAILDVRLGEAHQGQGLTNKLLGAARDAWKNGKANTRPYIRDDNDLGYWSSDAKNGKEWPSNKADEAEYEKSERPIDGWDEWHNKGQKGTTASRLNFNQAVVKTAGEMMECHKCGRTGSSEDFGDISNRHCPTCGSPDVSSVSVYAPEVSSRRNAAIDFTPNVPQQSDAYGDTKFAGDPKFYPQGTAVDMGKSPGLSGGQSGTFNPRANGADVGAGSNTPVDVPETIDSTSAKAALLIATAKVLEENPSLSNEQAHQLAMSTLSSFPVLAAGWNPMDYAENGFQGAGMSAVNEIGNKIKDYQKSRGPKPGTVEYFEKHQDNPEMDPTDPAHHRNWEKAHRRSGTAPAELQARRQQAGIPEPEDPQQQAQQPTLWTPPTNPKNP